MNSTDRPPQRLNIVHTESSLGWGGQEIRVLTESRGLIDRGHQVHLLCPAEARIFSEAARFGVPAEALPIGRKNLKGLNALAGWIREHRESLRPGVFNTHSSTDAWLVALALLICGRPVPMVRTRHISAPVPRNAATRWLYASATNRIVTTGEVLRRTLSEHNGYPLERIVSVPTGMDTQRFQPGDRTAARAKLGLPEQKVIVGIVATLRSWKGHRFLLEAFAELIRHRKDVLLLIVGDGPQREALTAIVTERGLQHDVVMAGNQDDVLPWLQAMDVFALPSYANEGVPQALMQAMLAGLPCVTTTAGSIGELAKHEETALVVPMQDPRALARSLERLIADPVLRGKLGAASRAHCLGRFSLERMLDDMEAVFAAAVREFQS